MSPGRISRSSLIKLNTATAALARNRVAFLARISETNQLIAEIRRQTAKRLDRIEAQLAEIITILSEQTRQLERRIAAVRDPFGFNGSLAH
jgi:hypothetical protein